MIIMVKQRLEPLDTLFQSFLYPSPCSCVHRESDLAASLFGDAVALAVWLIGAELADV
jgi:hypothetical protein